jgi:hypothetical protein
VPYHSYSIFLFIKWVYKHTFGSSTQVGAKVLRMLSQKLRPSKKYIMQGTVHLFIGKMNHIRTKLQSFPLRFYTHCLQMTLGEHCTFSFLCCTGLGLRHMKASSVACLRNLSPLLKLPTLACTFATCACRWSFFICCFDWRSASSINSNVPETHFFVLKWQLNEDLRHNWPPIGPRAIRGPQEKFYEYCRVGLPRVVLITSWHGRSWRPTLVSA